MLFLCLCKLVSKSTLELLHNGWIIIKTKFYSEYMKILCERGVVIYLKISYNTFSA